MRYLLAFLLIQSAGWAQVQPDSLEFWGNRMLNDSDPEKRIQAFAKLDSLMDIFLANPESFDTKLESVRSISALYAPDRKFRIITWNVPLHDGTYIFGGRVQLPAKKKKPYSVVKLKDKSAEINKPLSKTLSEENWYGALYYQITRQSYKKSEYYTLLGWDGNTIMSNKKLIDVLVLDNNGIKFGAPLFDDGKRVTNRVFFEHSEKVTMSLKYQPKTSLIVFDHLSPSQPSLEGMYEFYGPDFTYDAYKFTGGKWRLIRNYEARNDDRNEGKPGKYSPE